MNAAEATAAIVEEARGNLALRRVFLFGSRARGDARDDSDIDLAFEHDSSDAEFSDFVNRLRENAPTLLELDLVDLGRADPGLRARVYEEGTLLHG